MARLSPRNHRSQTRPKRVPEQHAGGRPTERRQHRRENGCDQHKYREIAQRIQPGCVRQQAAEKRRREHRLEGIVGVHRPQKNHCGPAGSTNHRMGIAPSTYHHQRSGRSNSRATSRTASGGQSAAPAPVAHFALQVHAARYAARKIASFVEGANRLHESLNASKLGWRDAGRRCLTSTERSARSQAPQGFNGGSSSFQLFSSPSSSERPSSPTSSRVFSQPFSGSFSRPFSAPLSWPLSWAQPS